MSSFMTTDTGKSIPNKYNSKPARPVWLLNSEGEKWFCGSYDGYCTYGRDIFVVTYEMNTGIKIDDNLPEVWENARQIGINMVFHPYVYTYLFNASPEENESFDFYDTELREEAERKGKIMFEDEENFEIRVIHPNLVENEDEEWKEVLLVSCPNQGHFY